MAMMTAVIDGSAAQATPTGAVSRIADVEVLQDLASAEPIWRALQQPPHLSTPYQRFELLAAWQRNVGAGQQISPFIVVARDAEQQPLVLLPLGLQRAHGLRIAKFLGGKHTTFNMALWQQDFAQRAGAADLAALIAGLRRHADKVDVLALLQQPASWRGVVNPLSLVPQQPSANDCPLLCIAPGATPVSLISNSFRRRLKSKEKKLQPLAGYRYGIATTDAEITALLDWFFAVKPLRMAAQKLPDVFAEPGIAGFIREACLAKLADGGRAIDIHALQCDDEPIAIFAGVADGQRFSMMFNTYTLSDSARYSPGLILMRNIIDHYAALGYNALDLGIGSDDYKRLFCKSDEPIFDGYIALTARGRFGAAALAATSRAKRVVKHNAALMRLVQLARGALRR
ncbi:GNAT family N-acetyltransferase [Rhodopseudomonas palustris]|uniref:BioF2-like acetyltransferase domain-containing protein n=1 Tax=Rhodopseudomonas palustris (strain BisB18) TaxID=316056 RepID=Q214F2_RHOPB